MKVTNGYLMKKKDFGYLGILLNTWLVAAALQNGNNSTTSSPHRIKGRTTAHKQYVTSQSCVTNDRAQQVKR